MRILIMTAGDTMRRTGGYLYLQAMEQELRDLGDSVAVPSVPAPPNPLVLPASAYLALELAATRPDVAIVDVGMAGRVAAPLALLPKPVRTPMVALLLQPPQRTLRGHHFHVLLENMLLRHAELVVTVGTWVAGEVQGIGVPADRIKIVRPGSDLPGELQPGKLNHDARAVHFLCVANWTPQKGIIDAVMAFDDERLRGCSLELVGDQTAEPAYSAWVRTVISRRHLEERVKDLGVVRWEEMAEHYAQSDALVLPSFTEGMPTVVAEAFRAGRPAIAYDIPAAREIIKDGVNGLLVMPGDVRALTGAVVALASDPQLWHRLSEGARSTGLSLPTWQESALLLRQHLAGVIATHQREG